ncbi:unnamed protein product [Vitrella brassicaformis CCMP3155]|uniref:H(+)-exporting diphosphatase n=1 Tax=Vitrella brassicaformis (strain CCMP3155) TaxID=1169540 RepID=A0A0G4FQH2_VITBC|nr:unnamed protein product [Vitrella brassicaformis CCMP3155]|eukprot:CEM16186.1 unnamed protein product [Vitrella brassicaformis CCMP3155]
MSSEQRELLPYHTHAGHYSAGGPHTSTVGFYGKSEKAKETDIERIVSAYNALDLPARSTLTITVTGGFFGVLFLLWLICSDFAIFVVLAAILIAIGAILFSLWLLSWLSAFDEGTVAMREVSEPIREGAEGFFAVQYGTIVKISFVFTFVIILIYMAKDSNAGPGEIQYLSTYGIAFLTGFTFIVGALCSALAGYSGMWVSVRANIRVASAARRCYNEALQLCFRGGAISSVVNVALAVGGISTIILFLRIFLPAIPFVRLPLLIVGYGFGASLVAMFAQLGGGIYTKGADVGADLVGKVEAGIPEDDPRNPAVIADLVGDNVGDCAGQCADLFESIAAEIISAMILGGALADEAKLPDAAAAGFVLFPLGVHCMDLVTSSIGILLVRTKKGLPDADSAAGAPEDPLKIMIRVYMVTCIMSIVGFAGLCRYFLYFEDQPRAWLHFSGCGAVGMVCAFLFVIITQYYTDYEYPQVKRIAEASLTGPATNIIAGISVGMESTALPVICISVAVIISYYLGVGTEILGTGKTMAGLFGTAVATMGMLCTAVFVLSMSSFGPIADNAGGIVEMSQQDEQVRAITDRLDAVGNVTKANTKGFSVGSASLACFLLFSAFLDEVTVYTGKTFEVVDLAQPEVFIGGLIGAMMVFLFSSWAMESVGRAAQEVVKEVRRQFSECPGIMDFAEKPDYHTCVAIVSRAALREMVKPGLLSVLSPLAVGFVFRLLGSYWNKPFLGAQVIASFLMFSTSTGILMALFLNNAGGAWDNAKKYVETGALGGKGSDTHKAAVVGDTVGDPSKDTAGPSVHVLIKLVATVTMVLTPVFVSSATAGDAAAATAITR